MKNIWGLQEGDYFAKVAYITLLDDEISDFTSKKQQKIKIWYALESTYGKTPKHILEGHKYTLTSDIRSTLYKHASVINEREIDSEGNEFNLNELIGKNCLIKLKRNGEYLNILEIKHSPISFVFEYDYELPDFGKEEAVEILS